MVFWVLAGALLAVIFAVLQLAGFHRSSAMDPQRMISKSMLQSGIRVLLAAALLYLSFSSYIQHGLACLIAFLLVRWISLFILAHKIKA
jgi:hypothetical protein